MKKLLLIISLFLHLVTQATHNRAGEITYKQISSYTYEITVTTFTNRKPTIDGTLPADRTQLQVFWGDNTNSIVNRTTLVDLPDYYRKNTYVALHTYPGPGTYNIFVEDPNRNEGVENIPNSVNVVFSINTILQINSLLGTNNTPLLLNPPIDKAGTYRKFIHNPAAYDPDGDSISYRLTTCKGENGEPIPNYTLPKSSNTPIYIDPIKGDLIWDSPINEGIFNVAFFIEEWRQGVKIGQITRDMQIEVFNTQNTPPVINKIKSFCITVGDTLVFNVSAYDSISERLMLYATSGIFEIDSSAKFDTVFGIGNVQGTFVWAPKCQHIRKSPYQIVFKSSDLENSIKLVDQQSSYITVIADAPKNLALTPNNNAIILNWDNYSCNNAKGFKIYRSINYYNYKADSCEIGIPPYSGYQLIETIHNINATQYIDNNNGLGLNQGFEYCYMLCSFFEDNIDSKASIEACTELERGIPVITNVSVSKHHSTNGEIYLAWSKPTDFDTNLYPAPYKYLIKRSNGIWDTKFTSIDSLPSLNDTSYIDKQINTTSQAYSYRIEIHNNKGLTEQPMTASSIFPKLTASDNTIQIQIQKNVPWLNTSYTVFRENSLTNSFDSIGSTTTNTYFDNNLQNNSNYCYQIKSFGKYNIDGFIKPIINYSHQNCDNPIDTTPPNPLILQVTSDCNTFTNTLSFNHSSPETDIIKYYIYYKPEINSSLSIIDSLTNPDSLFYMHQLKNFPSACYAVTAVDSGMNESKRSNIVCVDECTFYELPNVFTPNNDLINDFYKPITPYNIIARFVKKIDLKIYSRWGSLVYKTTNPQIQWDGKHYKNNKLVSPGVYYYTCSVYEKRISGIEERNIVGFIHVFYSKEDK